MLYEYECDGKDCGQAGVRVEVVKPYAEMERPEYCERCKRAMKRQVSRSSFQLKGTGWFKTDYPKS